MATPMSPPNDFVPMRPKDLAMHAQLALYEHNDCSHTNNATTLDLVDGRLWFGTTKLFEAGETPVFSIRLGWQRRITFKMAILRFAGRLPGENVYVGEFLDILPDDLKEIRTVILGSDCEALWEAPALAACA
jgi:hypothetical protein